MVMYFILHSLLFANGLQIKKKRNLALKEQV